MLKRINLLDSDTSNKIAAGEVVERPYSVVKELIENSIDANSSNITVEIIEGGQKSIKIIDDGDGIHPDDIEKTFLPHSTSKINSIDDIYKLHTFGFRGEALASIAAVSKVILRSRTADYELGKEICIAGGVVEYCREIGFNKGTSIEISDLFYNVPARLKFMKSSQREAALINDIVERLALVNPKISFKVFNNGNKAFFTFSSDKMTDTIRAVYGKNICENVIGFKRHSDIASVHGYIGNSEISRGSRNYQSVFVNKRYVKNKLITTAVENAFKSFLTINKYPFFILLIDIFPDLVDVNVHPTKAEIKFKDERFIFKLVFDAVHEALRQSLKDSFVIDIYNTGNSFLQDDRATEKTVVQLPLDLKGEGFYESAPQPPIENIDSLKENLYSNSLRDESIVRELTNFASRVEETPTAAKSPINSSAKFPPLSIIGQFNDSYILAQYIEDLYIIDQHAAHEKILFEKFTQSINNREVVVQILATPVVMELSSEDFAIYSENSVIFSSTGFNIDIFGENTISIREVPIILGKIEYKGLFIDILDNIKSMGTGETTEVKYDKIASLSCKAAVKANNRLTILEMKSLIEDLRFINDPFTCPHGRPTIIKITLNELEKRFKRIQ